MYPQRELIGLAAQKAALCRRIARQRVELAGAAAAVARPLARLDRAVAWWRRFSPLVFIAAMPMGILLKRSGSPRLKWIAALLKWGPIVVSAVRGAGATEAPPARVRSARSRAT